MLPSKVANYTCKQQAKEIKRLHSIIKEINELIEEYRYTNVEDYGKIIEFFKKLRTILDKEKDNEQR
jgi:predicted transcriptional regulator